MQMEECDKWRAMVEMGERNNVKILTSLGRRQRQDDGGGRGGTAQGRSAEATGTETEGTDRDGCEIGGRLTMKMNGFR